MVTHILVLLFRISIHAAREGGDGERYEIDCCIFISIHAAREGGDHIAFYVGKTHWISIHAAREGGDNAGVRRPRPKNNFNPRRP